MKFFLFWVLTATVLAQAPTFTSGPLAQAPPQAPIGSVYFATDQTTCSPYYFQSATGWTQFFSVGGSGALVCIGTSLDISNQVPRLNAANVFTGLNTFLQVPGATLKGPVVRVNGALQPPRQFLNIVGAGVTVTDNGTDTLTVAIPTISTSKAIACTAQTRGQQVLEWSGTHDRAKQCQQVSPGKYQWVYLQP